MSNFDLRKYLTENKLTSASKMMTEQKVNERRGEEIVFMDDSDLEYDRFSFVDQGDGTFISKDLENPSKDTEVVYKGDLKKILKQGEQKGFWEKDDKNHYYYSEDKEDKMWRWLEKWLSGRHG